MGRYLLKHANVWNGPADTDVLVEGERIVCLAPDQTAENAEVIDLGGKWLLPGLFNTHVHLYGVEGPLPDELIRRFVTGGVTTVRDMGMTSEQDFSAYQAWLSERRSPDYPTVVTAGKFIAGENTYGNVHPSGKHIGYLVDENPDTARAAVDAMLDAGADMVKTGLDYGMDPQHPLDYLSEASFRAICQRASERGARSAAHITKRDNAVKAAAWGLDECAHTPTDRLTDEDVAVIRENGMAVNTTISIFDMVSAQTGEQIMDAVLENVGKLYRAGVPMSAGTDFMHEAPPYQTAGVPIHELRMLVKAGLTVQEAIRLATADAASVCGMGEIAGSIEEGKLADLVVTERPIDETFSALEPDHICFVMHRGVVVKQIRP